MNDSDVPLELVPARLDTHRRFVRVTGSRGQDFVEFDFAIGEPELFVEMILGPQAFSEFCTVNRVEVLPPSDEAPRPDDDWAWRLADATQIRFRN